GLVLGAVRQFDGYRGGTHDDVRVGEDPAIRGQDDAGADRFALPRGDVDLNHARQHLFGDRADVRAAGGTSDRRGRRRPSARRGPAVQRRDGGTTRATDQRGSGGGAHQDDATP